MSPQSHFRLPFSRTNALPPEIFDFCVLADEHFPNHFGVNLKLRATFVRAVDVGVSQQMN
jgi:hypothetical protein